MRIRRRGNGTGWNAVSDVTDLLDRTRTATLPPRLQLLDAVAAIDAPLVRPDIAYRTVVFVNEPELIREVLVARAEAFEKSEFQERYGRRRGFRNRTRQRDAHQ